MVTKNKASTFLNQNWLPFPILTVMVLSGLYIVFYIFISLMWTPSNLQYWLTFPLFLYSGTYWTVVLAGFLFAFCGVLLILKLNRSNQVFLKNPLAISWSILSAFVLLVMVSCLLSSTGVDRLDSANYGQHTIQLAFRSNDEGWFSYYLVDCNRHTFQCKMIASFFPHDLFVSYDDARLSRLHISENGLVTVVTHNKQVIYEYSLSSE
jgi:hypothetical protein